jgi:hypothetical protein
MTRRSRSEERWASKSWKFQFAVMPVTDLVGSAKIDEMT